MSPPRRCVNTQVAAAAAMLVWLVVEQFKDGHATVLGGVTGAVGGLATITPAAGYVNTTSAVAIGALAGVVCHLALRLKAVFRYDDALDVIAVHFVGGVLGSLLVGLLRRRGHQQHRRGRVLLRRGLRAPRRPGARPRCGDRLLVHGHVVDRDRHRATIGLRVSPRTRSTWTRCNRACAPTTSRRSRPAARAGRCGLLAPAARSGQDVRVVSALVDARAMDGNS